MNKITSKNSRVRIEDFGYNAFFESNRKKLKLDDFSIARVVIEYRGAYKVKNVSGEYLAKITGKRMFNALSREDYPAVGDWVAISKGDGGQAIIHKVLPRKTIIKRKHSGKNKTQIIATNIDVAFVIESVDKDYSLNRFERYFSIINDGGIKSKIILNKIDLISKEELDLKLAQIKNRFKNIDIFPTSIITNEGLN
jgi:ribosome biogenesis GTPase